MARVKLEVTAQLPFPVKLVLGVMRTTRGVVMGSFCFSELLPLM